MEYKHIDQLLEKYWAAETSLEEERQLRDYFQNKEVAPQHEPFSALFQVFSTASEEEVSEDFDQRLLAQLQMEESPKIVSIARPKRPWGRYLSQVAAVAALLFGIWFVYWQPAEVELAQLNQQEKVEARKAYQEAKAALFLLSKKMNKGTNTAISGINQLEKSTKIFK